MVSHSNVLYTVAFIIKARNYNNGVSKLKNVVLFVMTAELFAHPLTPLYLMIKSYGIESYLMVNKMPNTFPRYDKPTPESLKRVCEEWVQAEMASGEKYNRDTCVLERTLSHVKQHVSQVDALDRRNPHIAFFLKTNPGYRQVGCYYCVKWRRIIIVPYVCVCTDM